jgi:hypothetical protein
MERDVVLRAEWLLKKLIKLKYNAKLTGRSPESWEIKPHCNRAPVERTI